LLVLSWAFHGAFVTEACGSDARFTPIVRAIERNRDAIVNIQGRKTVPTPESVSYGETGRPVKGMGTGVVVDERGYIVTNYHVVEGVSRIQVTLTGGRTRTAKLVARDTKTDLAIIKIPVTTPLATVTLGTSSDLMAGETVVAVGNAYGYPDTVTDGIISALHRSVEVSDTQRYDDLIQTSAPINPGNSGGPLLNIDGEMIGINAAVRIGAQGIGFAIPVDKAMSIAGELLSVERIDGNWHGVKGKTVVADRQPQFVVRSVDKDSPAAKAGLKPGDVVTAVDDKPTPRPIDFERRLLGRKVGEEISVTIKRDQTEKKVSLVLASLPGRRTKTPNRAWETLGMQLAVVPAENFRRAKSRYRGGLRVTAVRQGGPAAEQGIRRNDVLVGMHIWETVSMDNLAYVLKRADSEKIHPLKFYILRGTDTLYGHLALESP